MEQSEERPRLSPSPVVCGLGLRACALRACSCVHGVHFRDVPCFHTHSFQARPVSADLSRSHRLWNLHTRAPQPSALRPPPSALRPPPSAQVP
jgi:hypothetical protein